MLKTDAESRGLEMTLNSLSGHVMSLHMSPIGRECTSLYPHSVVSFAVYCSISAIFLILCWKIACFTPLLFHHKIGELSQT